MDLCEIGRERVVVCHSQEGITEESPEIIVNEPMRLGDNNYPSNWAISQNRHEVLFGMPWNAAHNPNVD